MKDVSSLFLYWISVSLSMSRPLRALLLLDQYRQKSRLFRSPVLLVPLGDDFRFVESREWDAQFSNYQKLFDYFNQHPELHIKVTPDTPVRGRGYNTWGRPYNI